MTRINLSGGVLMLVLVLAAIPQPSAGRSAQPQNPRAAAMAEFQDHVKDYIALRDKVEAKMAPPKPSNKPLEITARTRALAVAVRRARAGARPGDLFIPQVVPILRRVILEDLQQRSPTERAAALQQIPARLSLRVNDEYPKTIPLATVPPKLLAEMPRLPDGLEYRFVGRRLILHDTRTNLVVDILDDALPPR